MVRDEMIVVGDEMIVVSDEMIVVGDKMIVVSRRVGRGVLGCDRTPPPPPRAEKVRLEVTCSAENVNL